MRELLAARKAAQEAYDQAWDNFLNADPEYIDAATYALKAAELRYDRVIEESKRVVAG